MKKSWMISVILLASSCFLFRPKIAPYPSGAIFPMEETSRISYEGRIVGPLVEGEEGRVYFSTDGGSVYCLDGQGKNGLWQASGPTAFGCPPALGGTDVFIWDQDNTVHCLDREGRTRWRVKIPEKLSTGAVPDQERIYLGTEAGSLLALSRADGKIEWRFDAGWPIQAAPVLWGDKIIAGSVNGSLNFINRRGKSLGTLDLGGAIHVTPLVDDDRLYVGTEDSIFHCLDLKTLRRAWKFRAGGRVLAPPQADAKSVYFPASNSVIYAVDKKHGDIKWWRIMPARSSYQLLLESDRILAASFSPLLMCWGKKDGREIASYDLKAEARSNPVFLDPYLLIPVSDSVPGKGQVVFLQKKVAAEVVPSLPSPQPIGTEIIFTATTVGFYLPKYEFSLRQGDQVTIVQPESERNSWVWFAQKEGTFRIEVRVRDEKQAEKAGLEFVISLEKGAVK